MPILTITTNVAIADPKAFLLEFSSVSAKALGKDEDTTSTSYTYKEHLTFGASFDPAVILDIMLITDTSLEQKDALSKVFFQFLFEKLGVPPERGFITFTNAGPENIAWNSATVATILKSGKQS